MCSRRESSKHQHPGTRETSSTKFQWNSPVAYSAAWCLDIGICLEFGAWNLGFFWSLELGIWSLFPIGLHPNLRAFAGFAFKPSPAADAFEPFPHRLEAVSGGVRPFRAEAPPIIHNGHD